MTETDLESEPNYKSVSWRDLQYFHIARLLTWVMVIGVLIGGSTSPWLRISWPHHSVGLYPWAIPYLNNPIQLALFSLVAAQFIRLKFDLTSYVLELLATLYVTFWCVIFRKSLQHITNLYVTSIAGTHVGPLHFTEGSGVVITLYCSVLIIPGTLIGLYHCAHPKITRNGMTNIVEDDEAQLDFYD